MFRRSFLAMVAVLVPGIATTAPIPRECRPRTREEIIYELFELSGQWYFPGIRGPQYEVRMLGHDPEGKPRWSHQIFIPTKNGSPDTCLGIIVEAETFESAVESLRSRLGIRP